ncbi:hypothetical protein [Carboxylicivirga marina]|uniref:Outer membrane protein beta-barrel domain-containing protein n=1 Tax=Carboxylicivirga marina TaxID=2800988 RepID=A0ABS1HNM5_9BACT|nr:hypothetical protein [Carboxylicivirga marina]MBK3519200.1 hypothetical protein [Carboxylicivirga marina]
MKKGNLTILMLLTFSVFIYSQTESDTLKFEEWNTEGVTTDQWHYEAMNAYITINLINGMPIDNFSSNYSRHNLWGVSSDLVLSPISSFISWQPGVLYEYYHGGTDKADWYGFELISKSSFNKFNFINRFRFLVRKRTSPYFEVGVGRIWSKTKSEYTIVDEATFWEEFLFNEEDEYETHKVKKVNDSAVNFSIGVGCVFNNWINFQVKYTSSEPVTYVQKDNISVSAPAIYYRSTSSKIEMIVLSLGLSTELMYRH